MKKLGVFGGSFDPVHLGHLLLAESAWEELGLERLIFVPTQRSPWKSGSGASPEERWEMISLAVRERPGFDVSRLELDRNPPSYTIDTLEALQTDYPNHQLWLIIGADSIGDFPLWHRSQDILEIARVAVGQRPGQQLEIPGGLERQKDRFQVLKGPCCDISSTEIRERLLQNRSIHFRVPPAVEGYIREKGLF